MLAQLLKHEFRATRRLVPFVYLATLIIILGNLLLRQLDIPWLNTTMLVLMIVAGIGEVILTYVIVIYRYYKNLYNSEGYLMHTLPVPPRQLLTSKVIVSFVWLLISYLLMVAVVVTVALIMVGEQTGANLNLGELIDQLIKSTGLQITSFYGIIAAFAAYMLLSIIYLLSQIFLAISVGNLSRFHSMGIGAPIFAYLAIYFFTQIMTLLFMIAVPLGLTVNGGVLQLVPESMLATITNPNRPVVGLGSIIFIAVATIGFFVLTAHIMKRRTSLK